MHPAAVGILAVIAAFFVGSFSPATLVARARGLDISRHGSGNPGATNVGRVVGRGWGVAVGVADVLKGLLPVLAAVHWGDPHLAYAVGLAAVAGHMFSPFLRGKGGKGVATTFGALLGVHWGLALALVAVFLVVVLIWHWVAVGSIAAAVTMMLVGAVSLAGHGVGDRWTGVWALALGLLVAERHTHTIAGLFKVRRV